MMEKTVLFDWDGTLWDALTFIEGTYTEVFEMVGLRPWTRQEYQTRFKHDWRSLLPEMGLAEHEKLLVTHWEKRLAEQEPRAFKWAAPLLERLGDVADLALVSSAPKTPMIRELDRNGLSGYFKAIIGAEDVMELKPSPEPLLLALDMMEKGREKAAYVGDMAEDIMAARACGIKSLAVTWGIHEKAVLMAEKPDFMASKPEKLYDFITESL